MTSEKVPLLLTKSILAANPSPPTPESANQAGNSDVATTPEDCGISANPAERPSTTMRKGTPMRAIRAMCLDCVCGSAKEVALCTAPKCPLYPFRFGKRPSTVAKRAAREEASA